jgi:hypothetical protein
LASFIFQFILALKVVLAFQGLGNGVGFFWYNYDQEDDGRGASDEDLYQNIDDATSWFLLLLWLTFHCVLLVDAFGRNPSSKNKKNKKTATTAVDGSNGADKKEEDVVDIIVNEGILDVLRSSWEDKANSIPQDEKKLHQDLHFVVNTPPPQTKEVKGGGEGGTRV